MTYTYYPGCTLKTKAQRLDLCARKSAQALGFDLEEIEDWQCCGAVYPLGADEIAPKLAAVRTLIASREKNRPLVTLCSACHHVLKRVNHDMKNNKDINLKVNNYLEEEVPYNGETEVLHFMDVLQLHNLKENVKNPLKGRKIGAYYGCMLLRPSSVMQFDDPENPAILENFIKDLGAEPVSYPLRNECCGGYISLSDKDRSAYMAANITKNAKSAGADELITACPLCLYNINDLPISYFTEILAEALGVEV